MHKGAYDHGQCAFHAVQNNIAIHNPQHVVSTLGGPGITAVRASDAPRGRSCSRRDPRRRLRRSLQPRRGGGGGAAAEQRIMPGAAARFGPFDACAAAADGSALRSESAADCAVPPAPPARVPGAVLTAPGPGAGGALPRAAEAPALGGTRRAPQPAASPASRPARGAVSRPDLRCGPPAV